MKGHCPLSKTDFMASKGLGRSLLPGCPQDLVCRNLPLKACWTPPSPLMPGQVSHLIVPCWAICCEILPQACLALPGVSAFYFITFNLVSSYFARNMKHHSHSELDHAQSCWRSLTSCPFVVDLQLVANEMLGMYIELKSAFIRVWVK